jgi:Ca-activated chloride channel family protein
MTLAPPPVPPRRPPAPDPELLFDEARRHRRRRRARLAALVAAGLVAAGAAWVALGGGSTGRLGGAGAAHHRAAAASRTKVVVLVVDVSGSMRANDVKPTRLDAEVAALRAFAAKAPPDVRIGLVSFSTAAQVLVRPTTDRDALLTAIGTLAPEAGTALGEGVDSAVRLAVGSLKQDGIARQAGKPLPALVVLESDGAQNRGTVTPAGAAAHAKAAGIGVDGVSLGTRGGAVQFGFGQFANSIPVPPDPAAVAAIAKATGGTAANARTAAELRAAYARLAASLS